MKLDSKLSYTTLYILLGWLLFLSLEVRGQSTYKLVGSTSVSTVSDCYQLTEEQFGRTGAVWCTKLLNLTHSFELEFTVNFGANIYGADGIVFVMQNMSVNALGSSGSGMGYVGLQPSFGIEFDTFSNSSLSDPLADHIAIVRDGNNDHRYNSSFAPPVPISTKSNNIKDGLDHLVKVHWNVRSRLIQVSVDCVPRINQTVDLVNDVFKGRQEVYWGLTASAGNAAHTVCLQKDIVVLDTFQVCRTDTVTLVTGLSIDNKYDWKPTTGLDNSHIRTPHLRATKSQLYIVTYTDRCSAPIIDSVFVHVKTPDLNLGGNQQACEHEVINLNPTLTPANAAVKFHWSTGDTTRQLKPTTSGLYTLQITAEGCSTSDSSVVTFYPLPELSHLIDSTYDCPSGLPVLLDPQAIGNDLQFAWTPGDTKEPVLSASLPGIYTVKVSTMYGCSAEKRFMIRDNCPPISLISVPDAFTPNGDGINDMFEWKRNAGVEARMKIYNNWGEVIFSSDNLNEFWDGTWKGQLCPSSIYAWRLDYRSQQSRESQWLVKRGEVLLLR